MSIIDRIKNLFKRGGVAVGLGQELSAITDHPKINVDPNEYTRIDRDKLYFKGIFPDVKYQNSDHIRKERPYISLNMMQVVCRRLASLLYNEQSKVSIDTRDASKLQNQSTEAPDDETNDFVQSVLSANNFGKDFERYLESGLAMGGLVIRPYVDAETGAIKLAWIQAPNFFPLRSNTNEVTEAAIATPTTVTEHGRTIYYTLLEFHEWQPRGYTITNELYRSDVKGTVGKQVPVNTLYPDLADTVNMPGFSRPLFVYLKPAGFNNKSLNSPLGIGVCENALTTLKQLNDAYDQFNWEIQMGQRRIGVPEAMTDVTFIQNGVEEAKQTFDPDQNVFLTLPGDPDKLEITDLTSAIRANDYVTSINQFLKTLEMQVGLSAGTFSFDGQSLKTATEVVSENSMTYQTRNSHLTMVEQAIKELVISICELGEATVINGKTLLPTTVKIPTADQITVDFDDGIFTDKAATADYWIKLQTAGLCTDWQAIMHIQRVPEEQARKLAEEIAAEVAGKTPDTNEGMFGDGDA